MSKLLTAKIVDAAEDIVCSKYVQSLINLSMVGVTDVFFIPKTLSDLKESTTINKILGFFTKNILDLSI